MNFYIADTHFGHADILSYDNRPYLDARNMDEDMIDKWNYAVEQNDIVYILGDFAWGDDNQWCSILEQLKGKKVLIRGNHDPEALSDRVASHFEEVADYKEIDDKGRKVVLCHYPIPCFKNHYFGWYHLYGHVHMSFEANMMAHDKVIMRGLYDKPCNMYNVGCMTPLIAYQPRTLDAIIQRHEACKEFVFA